MTASRMTSGEESKYRNGLIDFAIPAFYPTGLDPSGGWADSALHGPGFPLPQLGVVQTVTSWM